MTDSIIQDLMMDKAGNYYYRLEYAIRLGCNSNKGFRPALKLYGLELSMVCYESYYCMAPHPITNQGHQWPREAYIVDIGRIPEHTRKI